MIRIIYTDGIMGRNILEVQEIRDCDKLTNYRWRRINENAMGLATVHAETGIVIVYVLRVHDEEDPWFWDHAPNAPYGEKICTGLASRLCDEVSMTWWRPDLSMSWEYRTVTIKPEEEDGYHD